MTLVKRFSRCRISERKLEALSETVKPDLGKKKRERRKGEGERAARRRSVKRSGMDDGDSIRTHGVRNSDKVLEEAKKKIRKKWKMRNKKKKTMQPQKKTKATSCFA